jgi:hypothetical protein
LTDEKVSMHNVLGVRGIRQGLIINIGKAVLRRSMINISEVIS